MKQWLVGLFCLCLLWHCQVLHGQTVPSFIFSNVTINSTTAIYAVAQDSTGIIWLGTDRGLYSYDGYHCYAQFAPHSMANTRINAICRAGRRLLLGTDGGLLSYDLHSGQYAFVGSKHFTGIRALSLQGDTLLYIGHQRGLATLSLRRGTFTAPLLAGRTVYALEPTPQGLLIGTLSGLWRYSSRRLTAVALRQDPQPLVNAICYDSRRRCAWIGTEGQLCQLAGNRLTTVSALTGNSIKTLVLSPRGQLFAGTDNGLFILEGTRVTHVVHDASNPQSLQNNIVWNLFPDRSGNLWLSTDNGFSMLAGSTFHDLQSIDRLTGEAFGNSLHALLRDSRGDLWMGGSNGLIHHSATTVVWYRQNNPQHPIAHNRVRKIYEDRDGDVWIATDHGINYFDRRSGQLRNIIVREPSGRYTSTWAYDILEDRQRRMWISAYNGGIFIVKKQRLLQGAPLLMADHHLDDRPGALSGIHVGQLVADHAGRIWARADGGRLNIIDPQSLRVSHPEGDQPYACLVADRRGRIWTVTAGAIVCYAGPAAAPQTFHIPGYDDYSGIQELCAVGDEVWAVADKTLHRITTAGTVVNYLVPGIEAISAKATADGRYLLIGGNDGLLTLRTDAFTTMPPAAISLSEVLVNGRLYLPTKGRARFLDAITLRHDENNISFELTDLPYRNHPSEVYYYRLEGSDSEWRFLQTNDWSISYNGLPYGHYRLVVATLDAAGEPTKELYSLRVVILPPWYLSPWAKLVYALFVIGLIVLGMKFYITRQRLHQEQRDKADLLAQFRQRSQFYASLASSLRQSLQQMLTGRVEQGARDMDLLIRQHLEFGEEAVTPAPIAPVSPASPESPAAPASPVAPAAPTSPADQRLLTDINRAIDDHIMDSDLNVTRLQELVGMGSKQLYRKLKTLTGHTPVDYIRTRRLQKAALLLREGRFSVAEVMYNVGFSKPGYFSKCFQQAYGMTPKEYSQATV